MVKRRATIRKETTENTAKRGKPNKKSKIQNPEKSQKIWKKEKRTFSLRQNSTRCVLYKFGHPTPTKAITEEYYTTVPTSLMETRALE